MAHEAALRTKKSEDKSLPSGLQIEHVLPQKWWTHWTLRGKQIPPFVAEYPAAAKDELLEIADEIRNRNYKLHTLGNLTLLNQYLNPAASNGSFDQKIVEYKNSVLRMNRAFDGLKAWDEASINARGQYLGELLCAIWARPKES